MRTLETFGVNAKLFIAEILRTSASKARIITSKIDVQESEEEIKHEVLSLNLPVHQRDMGGADVDMIPDVHPLKTMLDRSSQAQMRRFVTQLDLLIGLPPIS